MVFKATKVCPKCKVEKAVEAYYRARSGYRRSECAACTAELRRERLRKQDPEQKREHNRKRYAKRQAALAERSAAEQMRMKQYRAAISRAYRERHAERIRQRELANLQQRRDDKRRYAAERRRRGRGKVTREEWQAVVDEAAGCCFYCGKQDRISVDHIIALSKDGMNKVENLVGACHNCNFSKGANDPIEWIFFRFGADALARLFLLAEKRINGKSS